ncbi:MAG: alpha/beta hydrolase, partial [Pseudomonadales bacterium]
MNTSLQIWRDGGEFATVEPGGLRIFYRDFGEQNAAPEKTLLLLHGFPESSHSFYKVINGLQECFDRVVAFDMPGYGFSDKPASGYSYSLVQQADAALQLWRALGVRGGHALSHDMGTSVLTELLARHAPDMMPGWFDAGLQSATFTNGSMVLELAKLRVMQRVLLSKAGAAMSKLSRQSIFAQQVRSGHGISEGEQGALSDDDIDCLWQANCLQDGHRKNHLIIRYLNDRKQYENTRWLPALTAASQQLPVHICWG